MFGDDGREDEREGERSGGEARPSGPLPVLTGLLPLDDSDRTGSGLRKEGC